MHQPATHSKLDVLLITTLCSLDTLPESACLLSLTTPTYSKLLNYP